jgi:hypothetical protein
MQCFGPRAQAIEAEADILIAIVAINALVDEVPFGVILAAILSAVLGDLIAEVQDHLKAEGCGY